MLQVSSEDESGQNYLKKSSEKYVTPHHSNNTESKVEEILSEFRNSGDIFLDYNISVHSSDDDMSPKVEGHSSNDQTILKKRTTDFTYNRSHNQIEIINKVTSKYQKGKKDTGTKDNSSTENDRNIGGYPVSPPDRSVFSFGGKHFFNLKSESLGSVSEVENRKRKETIAFIGSTATLESSSRRLIKTDDEKMDVEYELYSQVSEDNNLSCFAGKGPGNGKTSMAITEGNGRK